MSNLLKKPETSSATVSFTLDGTTVTADAGETIWQAAGNPISSVLKYFLEDL